MSFFRSLMLLCVLVSLPSVTALAQPAANPCHSSFVTISDASGTALFKVAATVVTPVPAQNVFLLFYAGDYANIPTAVFRMDSGLTASAPTKPTAVCTLPSPSPAPVFTWSASYDGVHFTSVKANTVDAQSVPGALLFYNNALEANDVVSLPLVSPSPGVSPPPVLVLRSDRSCPTNTQCDPSSSPTPPGPGTGTCKTVAAYGYPVLTATVSTPGKEVYKQKLEMWPPIDNESECGVRQILFNVPNDLVDGLGTQGDPNAPNVQITVTGPAGKPVMTIYSISRQPNGTGFVLYTVDAQAPQDQQVNGDYYADIKIVGQGATSTAAVAKKPKG